MKKGIFLIATIIISVASIAQDKVGCIYIAPKAGITWANISSSEPSEAKLGFIIGGEAIYQTTNTFAFSGGLFFAQEGAKEIESGITATIKNNYLNFPLLANAYIFHNIAFKLGIQPAILLSAEYEVNAYGIAASVDTHKSYNSFDLSIPIGISYEDEKFILDTRYNIGLTQLLKDIPTKENGKNAVFQLTIGYKL